MSSSTLIMAIQHPQQSFGNYASSDHQQYSDHEYQRLRPPNATGFAHSHIHHGSSSTLPYGHPLQNFDLRESQYQNVAIDNHEYFKNANTTHAHKWTTSRQNYPLVSETLSTIMTDTDGFQNSTIYSNVLSHYPEQIHPFNIHALVPTRPPALFSSPDNLRPHDQYSTPPPPGSGAGIAGVPNFIQQNQSAQNYRLNTPAALLQAHQSSIRKTSSKAAKASSSKNPDFVTAPNPDIKFRPKNHACWMCNKCFDRPSTLRKHLLVHTGEKAFACNICGRRFGVASNMNRHAKRCALKPVNTLHNVNTNSNADVEAGGSSRNEIVSPSTNGTSSSPSISPTVTLPPSLSMVIPPSTSSSLALALGEPEGQSLSPQSATFTSGSSMNIMTPFSPTFAQRPMSVPAEPRVAIADKHPEAGGSRQRQRSTKTHEASGSVSSGRAQSGGRPQNSSPLLQMPSPSQVEYRASSSSPAANSQTQISEPKPKRRRRARSPSTWIPDSLIGFELDPVLPPASVPLPPIRPGNVDANGSIEERNSYDEQVSHMPYHPSGWSGKLPGPALITTEDTNGKGSLTYKFMF